MKINGLDYNTERERLRLKAYGREIQQMVEHVMALPTKAERQKGAEAIIETMKRVVPSQHSYKEREPMLWYHLALLSDFKLDVDYPYEFEHEDKMAQAPDKVSYGSNYIPVKHYGKLVFELFAQLKEMSDGPLRHKLAVKTAEQMYRDLVTWGFGSTDKERVVSDLARFTDGIIQLSTDEIRVSGINNRSRQKNNSGKKKK